MTGLGGQINCGMCPYEDKGVDSYQPTIGQGFAKIIPHLESVDHKPNSIPHFNDNVIIECVF